MPHPVWERHLHKCEKEREVRMMKAEKAPRLSRPSASTRTPVAMPDNERPTYLDTCGIAHIKDRNGNVKHTRSLCEQMQRKYPRFRTRSRPCRLRRMASPYDALKVCDTPEILFLKTGFKTGAPCSTRRSISFGLSHEIRLQPPPARLLHRTGKALSLSFLLPRWFSPTARPGTMFYLPSFSRPMPTTPRSSQASSRTARGNYGEREVETNMVLSVYSRQNFIRYFALLRDMDAFVFVSGRKIEALEDLSGLPLAGKIAPVSVLDRILQRPKCLG